MKALTTKLKRPKEDDTLTNYYNAKETKRQNHHVEKETKRQTWENTV